MFSSFITKELATAKNIKNRVNRQSVIRCLNKIHVNIGNKTFINGCIIYCGIIETGDEILEIIEPLIECKIFYYNCGSKFNTEFIDKFSSPIKGYIIFLNGEECIIYKYNNKFIKQKHISGNIIKRHKKGGQSQKRFERLAEESRVSYISRVIEIIKILDNEKIWLFGSNELCNMLINKYQSTTNINYGGFLNFNNDTINDSEKYINYLLHDDYNIMNNELKKMVYYLDTDPEYLDFDLENLKNMKYFICNDNIFEKILNTYKLNNDENNIKIINEKRIILDKSNKYYSRLFIFEYIGLKYFKLEDDYLLLNVE